MNFPVGVKHGEDESNKSEISVANIHYFLTSKQ